CEPSPAPADTGRDNGVFAGDAAVGHRPAPSVRGLHPAALLHRRIRPGARAQTSLRAGTGRAARGTPVTAALALALLLAALAAGVQIAIAVGLVAVVLV